MGEIVTGKRLPTRGKLLTFLAVCCVSAADVPQWLAAWERASTADLRAPVGAVRVRTALARRLGVHAAIQVDGTTGDLPPYVARDVDLRLQAALAEGMTAGCFVLLVGGSSVGKTRTAYEAVLAAVPDWWLVHPDADDVEALRSLTADPTARTIVWLDELQRYAGAAGGASPAVVRALLRAGTILVGTMWPDEYGQRAAPRRPGLADQYAADREMLRLAQVFDLDATFSNAELARAKSLAATDGRLQRALDDPGGGMTQVLAAGPELVRRWEQAPDPYARAVITAAVNARQLGMKAVLSGEFFTTAVPGYLTAAERAIACTTWLSDALAYATAPLHGAASALTPVAGTEMGQVSGFLAADYLLQHARITHTIVSPPDSAWCAMVRHSRERDVPALAEAAKRRLLYRYAEPLIRRMANSDRHYEPYFVSSNDLRYWLADLLVKQGRVNDLAAMAAAGDRAAMKRMTELYNSGGRNEDAIALLSAHADGGDDWAAKTLVQALVECGKVENVRERAAAGNWAAADALIRLLVNHGNLDDAVVALASYREHANSRGIIEAWGVAAASALIARALAAHGRVDEALGLLRLSAATGSSGASALNEMLAEHGCVDELRERAEGGDHLAGQRWAHILVDRGETAEAIRVLTASAAAHDNPANSFLARLLAKHGRLDDLRARADFGDNAAAETLAEQLVARGDLSELLRRADAGDRHASLAVNRMLDAGDDIEGLRARADAGQHDADATLASALMRLDRIEELRERVKAGSSAARGILVSYLLERGDVDAALEHLRYSYAAGSDHDGYQLGRLLVKYGHDEEAVRVLESLADKEEPGDDSDSPNSKRLTRLLLKQGAIGHLRRRGRNGHDFWAAYEASHFLAAAGREQELRADTLAGNEFAGRFLISLLRRRGRKGEADRAEHFGMNADGTVTEGPLGS